MTAARAATVRDGAQGHVRVEQTNRPPALGLKRDAGAAATSIALHLRSSAELQVQLDPQPFARSPLHAHGIVVLHRSTFAACHTPRALSEHSQFHDNRLIVCGT